MSEALDGLVALVARLRRECPWDREQSFETLKTYLLEETHEALAALDEGAPGPLCDELGDLLFQVFFLSKLAEERGWFGADDVARGITRKMVERHPHVFGDTPASSAQEVKSAWERRKRRQPGATEDPLGTLPAGLPALATAYRQTLRAGDLGFDWERDADVVEKSTRSSPSGPAPRAPGTTRPKRTRSATCCSRSSTSRGAARSTRSPPCARPTGDSATASPASRDAQRKAEGTWPTSE